MAPFDDVIKTCELWFRLCLILQVIRKALYNIFHNTQGDPSYIGLTTDPTALYIELNKHKSVIKKLCGKKIIKGDQFDLIYPSSKETDSTKFDITLLVLLIRHICGLPVYGFPEPIRGWDVKNVPATDHTQAAYCLRAREWRNFLLHVDPKSINNDKSLFQLKWNEGVKIAKELGCTEDIDVLQTANLDEKTNVLIQYYVDYVEKNVKDLQSRLDKQVLHSDNIEGDIKKHKSQISQAEKSILELKDLNEKLSDDFEIKSNVCTDKIQCLDDVMLKMNEKVYNLEADLKNQVEEVVQAEIEKRLSAKRLSSLETRRRFILPKVVDIVIEKIDEEDISKLIHALSNLYGWKQYDYALPNDNTLRNCLNDGVEWSGLKNCLETIGKTELISEIKDKCLLTEGLAQVSRELRNVYERDLSNWAIQSPMKMTNSRDNIVVKRDDFTVDLAILHSSAIDDIWESSDREFHMKRDHLERKGIELKELIGIDDLLVVVRGIAGTGKSTLSDYYTLQWAKNEILQGYDGEAKIDFLFKFSCRELNTFSEDMTLERILKECYPNIFYKLSLEDLADLSSRTLIIIDGVDELRDVDQIITGNVLSSKLRTIRNLMNPDSKKLPGHKTVLLGRPDVSNKIEKFFQQSYPVKTIEVCGFSRENVLKYIDQYFGENVEYAEKVKKKLEESENLMSMSTIPVFIWVICGIFNSVTTNFTLETITELYTCNCLLFIRNHLKQLKDTDLSIKPLETLAEDERILNMVSCLSHLSFQTLREKKVIFTSEDMQNYRTEIPIKETGFIYCSERGENKPVYQFRHLVLQEYFASLYIFLNPSKYEEYLRDPALQSCLPILCGIYGIHQSTNTLKFLTTFIQNLRTLNVQPSKKKLLPSLNKIYDPLEMIKERLMSQINRNRLLLDESTADVLSALFEYQGKIPKSFKKSIQHCEVSISNIVYNHHIRHLFSFLQKLQMEGNVSLIDIVNKENLKLPENLLLLLEQFYKKKTKDLKKNRIGFLKSSIMTLKTFHTPISKDLVITLPNLDIINKQSNLIYSLLKLVDEVVFSLDLGHMYPVLRHQIRKVESEKNISIKTTFIENEVDFVFTVDDLPTLQDVTKCITIKKTAEQTSTCILSNNNAYLYLTENNGEQENEDAKRKLKTILESFDKIMISLSVEKNYCYLIELLAYNTQNISFVDVPHSLDLADDFSSIIMRIDAHACHHQLYCLNIHLERCTALFSVDTVEGDVDLYIGQIDCEDVFEKYEAFFTQLFKKFEEIHFQEAQMTYQQMFSRYLEKCGAIHKLVI